MDAQEFILDADADTSITADTDDLIDFRASGQDLWKMDGTAAVPVNGLTFLASAAASPTQIKAHGSDTNIGMTLVPKGTGAFTVTATTGSIAMTTTTASIAATTILLDAATSVDIDGCNFIIDADADSSLRETSDDVLALKLQGVDAFIFDGDVASPVNGFTLKSSATNVAPTLEAQGTDSLINVRLVPKGATGVAACVGGWAVDGATNHTWRWQGSGTSIVLQENTGTATAPTWTTRNTFTTGNGILQGLTLLNVYSPSTAASVDINSQISSTYDMYMVLYNLRTSVDGADLRLRTDSNNGASFDTGAGDYAYTGYTSTPGTLSVVGSASNTFIDLNQGTGIGNATNEGASGQILLTFKGSASMYPQISFTTTIASASTAILNFSGSGWRASAAAIDAMQLAPSSGTVTGSVWVYGFAKAL